jgi:hypothetical protein
MVTLSKAMEDKLNAIKGQKMECGCGWNSIKLIWQSVGDNGDCEEIVKVMNKFKEDLQTSGTATVKIQYMPFDTNKPLGRISIGDICIDNFSLELLPHDASGVQVYSSKKDQYDDSAVKISGNSLIFNDYQSPTTKTLTLKTDNNDQTILVEKWLFEKVFFNKVNSNSESNDLKYKSGREYGWLSASQESQNPCDIGYDETGGCSYGKHQMAVRTGKINEFFLWLSVNYKNDLKETYKDITEEAINLAKDASSRNECKNCKFTQVFNKFCNDDKFISLAHKFIAERNYKPVYDKIISNFGDTKLFKNLNSQDEESLRKCVIHLEFSRSF